MNNSALIIFVFFIDMALLRLAIGRRKTSVYWLFVWITFNVIGVIFLTWRSA
jgi:hypothetical protein